MPDDPVAIDAARYLLRLGRPHASNDEVERATRSVIADPAYRDELAKTVANGLLFDLRTAMSILDRHDEDAANVPPSVGPTWDDPHALAALSASVSDRCACGWPERHTNLPCSKKEPGR